MKPWIVAKFRTFVEKFIFTTSLPVTICGAMGAGLLFGAYLQAEGFSRYWLIFLSGISLGYILLLLLTPMRVIRFSIEQKRYVEAETALMFIAAANKASEVTGQKMTITSVPPPPSVPPANKLN